MTTDHTIAEPLPAKENRGRNLTRYELETVINFTKKKIWRLFLLTRSHGRNILKREWAFNLTLTMGLAVNLTRYRKTASENHLLLELAKENFIAGTEETTCRNFKEG